MNILSALIHKYVHCHIYYTITHLGLTMVLVEGQSISLVLVVISFSFGTILLSEYLQCRFNTNFPQ